MRRPQIAAARHRARLDAAPRYACGAISRTTIVSGGTTFRFDDNLQGVWGEVSAGVNFFNVSQTTTVFAKLDTTFGDNLTGVGGKAGLRVVW